MKIIFIINNKNNRLQKTISELCQFFDERYPGRVEYAFTLRKKHAMELAMQGAEMGCDYLVVVGGDGTLNEVINGVFRSKIPADQYPVIGLLPCGSANDFARTAGITFSMKSLDEALKSGISRKIDVGVIRFDPSMEIRYFINMAGIGLGAKVVQYMERSRAILGPGIHYSWNILRGFLGYRKTWVNCSNDAWQWHGSVLQIAVGNGRYFGNGICITPDARLDDGQLQVAIFGNLSLWDYIKNLGRLKKGTRIDHPQVSYYTAEEIRLEGGSECGIEADGEFVGLLPAIISILPERILMLAPG